MKRNPCKTGARTALSASSRGSGTCGQSCPRSASPAAASLAKVARHHLVKIIATVVLLADASIICAQTATNVSEKRIRVVLVGDSTVNDGGGWGYGFKQFLTGDVECINTAANGRSSKSFLDRKSTRLNSSH